jgi:hypothetical protein
MKDLLLRPVAHLVWLVLFLILMDRPRRHYAIPEDAENHISSVTTSEAVKDLV